MNMNDVYVFFRNKLKKALDISKSAERLESFFLQYVFPWSASMSRCRVDIENVVIQFHTKSLHDPFGSCVSERFRYF